MSILQTAVTAKAHTNIALVKYWGKADQSLIIPTNDSISLTLDHFYTTTTVRFDAHLTADEITLDGLTLPTDGQQRMRHFMDMIRHEAKITTFAHIETANHVPTAAGLASSASGFAALAGAAAKAAGLSTDRQYLSRLARRGSGSASRSLFGGFVHWHAGHDDASSFAEPLTEKVTWPIRMIAIVTSRAEKKIGSTNGMQASQSSPYFADWVKTANADISPMTAALFKEDIKSVGEIAEHNAMSMHATTLSAEPPFTYFNSGSLQAMQAVQDLRLTGVNCYYTMDAGPNVKVLCEAADVPAILARLQPLFGSYNLVVAKPGPGLTYL
ncbi:diphosphomevalonate decarboxylase [Furfurilactobacillus siliginis]|uniref:diphosphomevalonate decarboxylase n=1 Tax=Furfurilactobacillus siliginis TaxID=348151 RepID=A0A0R2L5N0_9LACO|nr:diphosphomevalonate decarboxylase [Furfurilactobacillus siliginis]KRN96947.1 mvaD protein [Furfurilactobacillus siliginis]GEK27706.1 diphosphomevalonate decarboxylase [Furfurilactobacillus siliginis]